MLSTDSGSSTRSTTSRRSRGIRLGDLDRGQVYLIAYSGRRWEIVGAEASPGCGDAARMGGGGAAPGAQPRTAAPAAGGRHAAPDEPSRTDHHHTEALTPIGAGSWSWALGVKHALPFDTGLPRPIVAIGVRAGPRRVNMGLTVTEVRR